ncbi:MAG: ATP-binding cassette domain-containing protein [Leptospirales bacterium]
MDAVKTVCDECNGKRYHSDILALKYQSKSISDVLNMTVSESLDFFKLDKIRKHLTILNEVGLSYLKIGQSLSTLSGGESQRLKIATELHKEGNIYVMDEPTTGLHMSDIDNLYRIVKALVDCKNTVLIIEHNLDIIKHADWIIDLGPEGGNNGGKVLFEGIPEDMINEKRSLTGKYLKEVL